MSTTRDTVARTDELAHGLGCLSNLEALLRVVGDVSGLDVLDVGCGDGAVVRELVRLGARATGIDPHLAPGHSPEFVRASAEAIPMPSASFDAVTFVFSLHHVPSHALEASLHEARRLLRKRGKLYVAEPMAEGSFQYLIEPFHDETRARADAAKAMRDYLQADFGETGTFFIRSAGYFPTSKHLLPACAPKRASTNTQMIKSGRSR